VRSKKKGNLFTGGYAMYFMFKVKYSNHPPALATARQGTDYATVDKMFTIYNNEPAGDNLNELISKLTSALNYLDETYSWP
jgi:hypothetical protein